MIGEEKSNIGECFSPLFFVRYYCCICVCSYLSPLKNPYHNTKIEKNVRKTIPEILICGLKIIEEMFDMSIFSTIFKSCDQMNLILCNIYK